MASEPKWLKAARAKLGTREAAGPANNPTILRWATRIGTKVLGIIYNADSVPWCGVFVAACLQEDGIGVAPIAVRATSWSTWGLAIRPERVAPGAVLVFDDQAAAMLASMSVRTRRRTMSLAETRGTR